MGDARAVSYVIFDMDGVLLGKLRRYNAPKQAGWSHPHRLVRACSLFILNIDTETIYTEATSKIVRRFGKTFEWSVKSKMMGQR